MSKGRLPERRHINKEAEALVASLHILINYSTSEEVFPKLLEVFRTVLAFDNSFILELKSDGKMYPLFSTSPFAPEFMKTSWVRGNLIEKVLQGETSILSDVAKVEEWNVQQGSFQRDVRSALFVPLRDGPEAAVLVCTHSKRDFFSDQHLIVLKKFAPFATQALSNQKINDNLMAETQGRISAEALLEERQKQMMTASKMAVLGEMAGEIAHEVNNPLAIIDTLSLQLVDLLDSEQIERDVMRENCSGIQIAVKRITKIISGLRTFARDGTNDPFQKISVQSVVDNALSICSDKLRNRQIEISLGRIPEGLFIKCRPTQIEQVLINLISNSHDAVSTLQDKWVKIDIIQDRTAVEIHVTDSGKGIPIEVQDKMFQPFFTTKAVGTGTGLGLSISKGLIESHMGSLSIDNKCANTRFVIRLPASV